jgi:hypothetical protein
MAVRRVLTVFVNNNERPPIANTMIREWSPLYWNKRLDLRYKRRVPPLRDLLENYWPGKLCRLERRLSYPLVFWTFKNRMEV